jgi:heme/copper-type cytochrome/quinol oxidase subunit 4
MEQPPDDEDAKHRANLIITIAVVILVVGSVWLLIAYKNSSNQLDCFAAGHRNCAPIDVPP